MFYCGVCVCSCKYACVCGDMSMYTCVCVYVCEECSKGMDDRWILSRHNCIYYNPHIVLPTSPYKKPQKNGIF